MILDNRTTFVDNLSVAAAAGTALLGNQVDLVHPRDIGNGHALFLIIVVEADFTSGGAATVEFQLVSDAQAAIATNGSATVHLRTGAIPIAQLEAGKVFAYALPLEGNVYEQFLGILAVTGTATTTAGSISAFLSPEAAKWKPFVENDS